MILRLKRAYLFGVTASARHIRDFEARTCILFGCRFCTPAMASELLDDMGLERCDILGGDPDWAGAAERKKQEARQLQSKPGATHNQTTQP